MLRIAGAHGSLFVSDSQHVTYLSIPRAASTTFRGVMRDLGADIRRRRLAMVAERYKGPGFTVFNNSRAIPPHMLTAEQRKYFTFTFVAEPIHHVLDGAGITLFGAEAPFNTSAFEWRTYQASLAQAHKRSAGWLQEHIFFNPHLYPQAWLLARHLAEPGARLDFIGSLTNFQSDWSKLVDILRARGVTAAEHLRLGRHGDRRSSDARHATLEEAAIEGHAFVSEVGLRALANLCRIRHQEFECLGFQRPAACTRGVGDTEQMLQTRTGWVFG